MFFPLKEFLFFLFLINASSILVAQTTVSGIVIDANTQEPLEGVNIAVIGTIIGTTTDTNGNYILSTDQKPPLTIA